MNRQQIMNRLYDKDYLRNIHEQIVDGLVGSLQMEYLMKDPNETLVQKEQAVNTVLKMPIFHAMVDMMTANLLHHVVEKVVDQILEVVEELEVRKAE